MSEYGDLVQAKCDAFADRVVKLNDYWLEQASLPKAAFGKSEGGSAKADYHTSALKRQPSKVSPQPSRVPVHLKSVAAIANQLLRSGTSVGANNSEATSAIRQLLEQREESGACFDFPES